MPGISFLYTREGYHGGKYHYTCRIKWHCHSPAVILLINQAVKIQNTIKHFEHLPISTQYIYLLHKCWDVQMPLLRNKYFVASHRKPCLWVQLQPDSRTTSTRMHCSVVHFARSCKSRNFASHLDTFPKIKADHVWLLLWKCDKQNKAQFGTPDIFQKQLL